jgi:hypothetical protein
LLAKSLMVIVMLSGTPSALVVLDPKLEVMSLRMMPLWFSTFAPLEPSPGNGPAVSSGSSPFAVSLVWVLSGAPPGPPSGGVAPAGRLPDGELVSPVVTSLPHAPCVIRPAPASPTPATNFSMPRRCSNRGRS